MKATIVLVNYYGEEAVRHFIQHELRPQKGVDLQIVIVDNGHHNAQMLSEIEGVHLLNPPKNLGYLGALEYVVKSLSIADSDFLILSNFDLHFNAKDDLAALLHFGKENQLQVFGPQIVNLPSGAEANPMYSRRPEKSFYQRLLLVTSFYPIYWIYQWLHRIKKTAKSPIHKASTSIYAIHGSMMIFDKTFMTQGSFAHPAFLYGEEMLIAEQCHIAGWKIGFDQDVRVYHQEHSTTGTTKNSQHMRYLHDSLKAIYSKYYA